MRLKILFTIFIITSVVLAVIIGIRYNNLKEILFSFPQIISKLSQKSDSQTKTESLQQPLEKVLYSVCDQLEIPKESIKHSFSPNDSLMDILVEVPKGKPVEFIIWKFSSAIKKSGYIIKDCYLSEKKGCLIKAHSRNKKSPKLQLTLKQGKTFFSKTGKIAILVEDFKFSADKTTIDFLSFPEPLTVSLIGEKKTSLWSAQISQEYRKEIVILLPMEPLPKSISHYSTSAIMIHYSDDKIRSLINQAAEHIPKYAGFCNLSGSRVLEDTRVMNIVCQEINKMSGYFIISPESRKSVAVATAQNIGLRFREIDFSFTNALSESLLMDSLRHCAILAQKKGSLLVRGKSNASFIKALNECLPIFLHNGIQFVYVSELFDLKEKKH